MWLLALCIIAELQYVLFIYMKVRGIMLIIHIISCYMSRGGLDEFSTVQLSGKLMKELAESFEMKFIELLK